MTRHPAAGAVQLPLRTRELHYRLLCGNFSYGSPLKTSARSLTIVFGEQSRIVTLPWSRHSRSVQR